MKKHKTKTRRKKNNPKTNPKKVLMSKDNQQGTNPFPADFNEYVLLDLRNNRFPKKCPLCGLELKRKKVKKREESLFQEIVCKGKRKWLFFHEKCPFKKEIIILKDGTG